MTINHNLVSALARRSARVERSWSSRWTTKPSCPFSSRISSNSLKPYNSIPGPKPLPLIGNAWRYLPVVGEYDLEKAPENAQANLERYGPLVRESLIGSHSILHIFDPKDMETVFRNEGKYPARRSHRALLKYRRDRPEIYSSGGMFPENGEPWYRLRKLVQNILLSQSSVNQFISAIDDTCEQMISNIHSLNNRSRSILDLVPHLYRWALDTNGRVFVGKQFGCLSLDKDHDNDGERLIEAIHETHEAILSTELGATDIWKYVQTADYQRLVRSQDEMGEIIARYIADAKRSGGKGDGPPNITSQLYQQTKATDKDVFTIIMDLFQAGFDTTAFVVSFTLYHLSCHQQYQAEVRSEIMRLLPNKNDPMTIEVLSETKYLKACVKESLRLNPLSIGTGRVTTREMNIADHQVPQGTMLIIQNQVACLQETNFPRPKEFIPDRWLSTDKGLWPKPSPFALLPFGYGARMCIGRRLSELEIYIFVAKMLRSFQIDYDGDTPYRAKTRFINVPEGPLRLRFTPM